MGKVIVFKVGGKAEIATDEPFPVDPVPMAQDFGSVAMIEHGKELYFNNCMVCHGDSVQSGGIVTDLRWSQYPATQASFEEVVLGGKFASGGMAPFPEMSKDDVESIRAYIINRANEDAKALAAAPAPAPK